MDINILLSRLEKVRATGPLKWSACCPSHTDKTPSLAIREMADGRVLIHCFGGCSPLDVVGAVGLELSDLMPGRIDHHFAPIRRPWTGDDALRALAAQTVVVGLVAADLMEGRALTDADVERFCLAAGVISRAMEYVHGLG
jgi:hypothetical protein